MIRKSDWQTVHEVLTAEDRRRLGVPPTAEELEAYSRGDLRPEEEARVRALLVAYPELALEMVAEFPSAEAADADDLSAAEVSRRWNDFRQTVQPEPPSEVPNVRPFRYLPAAFAAALALVFAGLYWRAENNARQFSAALTKPRILATQQLTPDGRRGGGDAATTITVEPDGALVVVPLISQPHFKDYRIEVLDRDTNQSLWSSMGAQRQEDDSFLLVLPRELLSRSTRLQVAVYGVDGTREEKLATYSIQVAP